MGCHVDLYQYRLVCFRVTIVETIDFDRNCFGFSGQVVGVSNKSENQGFRFIAPVYILLQLDRLFHIGKSYFKLELSLT